VRVSVGTFNLNNLFSRWNFSGAVDELEDGGTVGALTLRYEFTDPGSYVLRTFRGRLVKEKRPRDTERVAARIIEYDLDVLAVQEVENISTLRQFNDRHLGGLYPHVALIEGNDARFIDVGLMSKLPLGALASFQAAVHPEAPEERVFSRDLVEVEVLDPKRRRRLFTLYVTHLKSKFVPYPIDPVEGAAANDARRRRQAESVATIVGSRQRPDGRYVIVGDMNDLPDAAPLAPLQTIEGRALVDGLAVVEETRPPPADPSGPGPATPRWTHRFKPTRQEPRYELLDQIWLSESMGRRLEAAKVGRRRILTGEGSDHDPVWVILDV
jgi:endonuclease/exonuclease/phosphatase family metal-dependent hydrolase